MKKIGKSTVKALNERENLTLRQEKVIKLTLENEGKSKREILEKAGYSKTIQKNPQKVFDTPRIKKEIDNHRGILEDLMLASAKHAAKKLPKATFRDAVDATDKLKKHLNVIDGVSNGSEVNVMVLPGEIVKRYGDNVIDGEVEEPEKLANPSEKK